MQITAVGPMRANVSMEAGEYVNWQITSSLNLSAGYGITIEIDFPSSAAFTATIGNGISTPSWDPDAMQSTFTFTVPTSTTENWPQSTFAWRMFFTDPSGNKLLQANGRWAVSGPPL